MSEAAALYTALTVAAPWATFAVRSSLKAPQKLVAPPMTAFVGAAVALADFVAVGEPFVLAAVEPVPVGDAEPAPVGVVDGFELATSLEPEEHPASTPTSTHMKASRRIVTTPLLWSFPSPAP
jgi:hypothetical protein